MVYHYTTLIICLAQNMGFLKIIMSALGKGMVVAQMFSTCNWKYLLATRFLLICRALLLHIYQSLKNLHSCL